MGKKYIEGDLCLNNNLTVSGTINPNNNNFGLTLPSTTNYTSENKTIAVTDDLPKVKRFI